MFLILVINNTLKLITLSNKPENGNYILEINDQQALIPSTSMKRNMLVLNITSIWYTRRTFLILLVNNTLKLISLSNRLENGNNIFKMNDQQ